MNSIVLKLAILLWLSSISLASGISFSFLVENMKDIKSGETISLGDKNATYVKYLGSGNTTAIHEVTLGPKSFALRVPKHLGRFNTFSNYSDYIDAFYIGHSLLKAQGVRVPFIHSYQKQEFIIVENLRLKDGFDLEDFFFSPDKLKDLDRTDITKKLYEFMESIATFKNIKDFHLGQLVYSPTNKEWILMDWTLNHELFSKIDDPHPFSSKLLHETWRNKVYFQRNYKADIQNIPDLIIDDETQQVLSDIEELINSKRRQVLAQEELQIRNLKSLLHKAKSITEISKLINEPTTSFSKNYNKELIDTISKELELGINEIAQVIPEFLISSNDEYIRLLENLIDNDLQLDELSILIDMKDTTGLRIGWELEMKVQKIITQNEDIYDYSTYAKLLESSLVTNYAKAWLKRERLSDKTKASCIDLLRSVIN